MNILKSSLLALALIAGNCNADSLEFTEDKAKHLVTSSVIASGAYWYTESWQYSMTLCMGVGLSKELYDQYSYGGFSKEDLAYDFMGCVIGTYFGDKWISLYKTNDIVGITFTLDL